MTIAVSTLLKLGLIAGVAAVSQQARALNLGSLVYEPVEPCRIVNVPLMTAGIARSFVSYGTGVELAPQGGDAAGCDHPRSAEGMEPVAIAANVTAVGKQASGNGNVVAFPTGSTIPSSSLVNFTTAANIANSTIIGLCEGDPCAAGFDLLANFSNVPAIVDVQGYFYPKDLKNVITVSPSGGDFATIVDALAMLQEMVDKDLPGKPDNGNEYTVKVGPGLYDGQVKMVPHVNLEGAGGSCSTTLAHHGSNDNEMQGAAVVAANRAFLDDVCIDVDNSSASSFAGGVYVGSNIELEMQNVGIEVAGASNTVFGIWVEEGSQVAAILPYIGLESAPNMYGVRVKSGSDVAVVTGSIDMAPQSAIIAQGMSFEGSEPPLLVNTFVRSEGTATQHNALNLDAVGGDVRGGTFTVIDGGSGDVAIRTQNSQTFITGAVIQADSLALRLGNGGTVTNSQIFGNVSIEGTGGVIANSRITGTVNDLDANKNCKDNYDTALADVDC